MAKLQTRYIKVVITLVNGKTFDNGTNQVIINDATLLGLSPQLSVEVTINETSSNLLDSSADIKITGVDNSLINELSTIGLIADQNFAYFFTNQIQVYAGYDKSNQILAYQGSIARAFGDYSAPDRALILQCSSTAFQNLSFAESVNLKGSISVASIYSSIANKLNLSVINDGVSATITNPIFTGGVIDQLRQLSKMTQTSSFIKNGTLYISTKKTNTNPIVSISKTSGMIGYPRIDDWGIQVRCYFNPSILPGDLINIASYVGKANGNWIVYSITTSLQNNGPNWFSDLKMVIPQYYGAFST